MREDPGQLYASQIESPSRDITFSVYMQDGEGVMQEVSGKVKNISILREVASSHSSVFAGAIGSEAEIVMAPDNITIPPGKPIRRLMEIHVGIAEEELLIIRGPIRHFSRDTEAQEVQISMGDMAAFLMRNMTHPTPLIEVNSAVYIRQIIEAAGVTSRIMVEEDLLMAIDFDANDPRAICRTQPTLQSGIQNNAVEPLQVEPLGGVGLRAWYENSNRSQKIVIPEEGHSAPEGFVNPPLFHSDIEDAETEQILDGLNEQLFQQIRAPAGGFPLGYISFAMRSIMSNRSYTVVISITPVESANPTFQEEVVFTFDSAVTRYNVPVSFHGYTLPEGVWDVSVTAYPISSGYCLAYFTEEAIASEGVDSLFCGVKQMNTGAWLISSQNARASMTVWGVLPGLMTQPEFGMAWQTDGVTKTISGESLGSGEFFDGENEVIGFGGFFSIDKVPLGRVFLQEVAFERGRLWLVYNPTEHIELHVWELISGVWVESLLGSTEKVMTPGVEEFIGVSATASVAVFRFQDTSKMVFSAPFQTPNVGKFLGVSLVAPRLEPILAHSADGDATPFTETFPGMTIDNVAVGVKPVPTPLPAPGYSLQTGRSQFMAASYAGDNPWNEIRSVAESELGFVYVDSLGKFLFLNRHNYLIQDEEPDKLLTDAHALKGASIIESEDSLRNNLRIMVNSQTNTPLTNVWSTGQRIVIPGNESIELDITVDGVLTALDGTLDSTALSGRSRFRAAIVGSGGGGDAGSLGGAEQHVSVQAVPNGRHVKLLITNNFFRSIALVDGSGQAYVHLYGSIIRDNHAEGNQRTWVTVSDEESEMTYGRRGTEIGFRYITSVAQAEALGQALLDRYHQGISRIDSVRIVGDSRLEIADSAKAISERMNLDGEYIIEKIEDYLGPSSGHGQSLDLMASEVLSSGSWFILDVTPLDDVYGLAF